MWEKCGSLPEPPQKGQVQVALWILVAVMTGGVVVVEVFPPMPIL
jgi:hypothetical protein